MKTNILKLALVSTCLAFTMAACSSNKNSEGSSDSDSLMMDTASMSTDTAMMDTSSAGTMPGVTGTNSMGAGTDSGTVTGTNTPPNH